MHLLITPLQQMRHALQLMCPDPAGAALFARINWVDIPSSGQPQIQTQAHPHMSCHRFGELLKIATSNWWCPWRREFPSSIPSTRAEGQHLLVQHFFLFEPNTHFDHFSFSKATHEPSQPIQQQDVCSWIPGLLATGCGVLNMCGCSGDSVGLAWYFY